MTFWSPFGDLSVTVRGPFCGLLVTFVGLLVAFWWFFDGLLVTFVELFGAFW